MHIPGSKGEALDCVSSLDHSLAEKESDRQVFVIAGSAREIVARIEQLAERGARNLFIPSVWGDPPGYATRLAKEVLPAFR